MSPTAPSRRRGEERDQIPAALRRWHDRCGSARHCLRSYAAQPGGPTGQAGSTGCRLPLRPFLRCGTSAANNTSVVPTLRSHGTTRQHSSRLPDTDPLVPATSAGAHDASSKTTSHIRSGEIISRRHDTRKVWAICRLCSWPPETAQEAPKSTKTTYYLTCPTNGRQRG